MGTNTALDDIVVHFQTMPQTTSAVALWMVKLDAIVSPHLEKVQSKQAPERRKRMLVYFRLCFRNCLWFLYCITE